MIKLLIDNKEIKFETTIFPDGTSQIWKVEDLHNVLYEDCDAVILWLFENESELIRVVQLAALLQRYNIESTLRAPYLPYGRQDKEVDNNLSFALNVFTDILYNANICRIESFDPHSKTHMVYHDAHANMPTVKSFHDSVIDHDVIVFPDHGARDRYKHLHNSAHVYFSKIRDQVTGVIKSVNLENPQNIDLAGKKLIIIDDICDGGNTFIHAAAILKEYNPECIDLAVSHGLFSKGKLVLHSAGISNIYTTNSLLNNPEGFKVW